MLSSDAVSQPFHLQTMHDCCNGYLFSVCVQKAELAGYYYLKFFLESPEVSHPVKSVVTWPAVCGASSTMG